MGFRKIQSGCRIRSPALIGWFDAGVAQLVERLTCNEDVVGSTPITGSILYGG